MSVERYFLGGAGPFLPRVADFIYGRFAAGGALDLSAVLVVTPSGRSGRRLLELLIDRCAVDQGGRPLVLTPPEIITVGQLPERLYESRAEAERLNALPALFLRLESLRGMDGESLQRVVRHPPDPDDLVGWSALAAQLDALAMDLARFDLRVADLPAKAAGDAGTGERLQALADMEAAYRRALQRTGASDAIGARFQALAEQRCRIDGHLVLVAVADLGSQLAAMLQQAARAEPAPAGISVLIQAPQEHAAGFDELGGFRVEYWQRQRVPLADEQISLVERSIEQPARVVELVAAMNRELECPADEISIGLGDEEGSALPVRRAFELMGSPAHRAAGEPVSLSGPAILLGALADFSAGRRHTALAALLRHPDLESYLDQSAGSAEARRRGARAPERERRADPIFLLDAYQAEHLQERPGEPWLADRDHRSGELQTPDLLIKVFDRVCALLPAETAERRPINGWVEPITRILAQVYGERVLKNRDPDDAPLIESLRKIRQQLDQLAGLDGDRDCYVPRVDFAGAVGLLLLQLQGEKMREQPAGPAVELLGFLELALDDARLLIVTDMNEGVIPTSRRFDPFLPDSVRGRLGLEDNRRRYARDLMRLVAILQGHEQVRLIAPRRDRDNNPLSPSRLLLACDDRTLIKRVRDFYDEQRAAPPVRPLLTAGKDDLFDIPYPESPDRPLDRLSVTGFNDYLGCPYRFYLKRARGLESIDDRFLEMEATHFGNLAHAVLESFGRDGPIDSTDPGAIAGFLLEQLAFRARQTFGARPRAAIDLQLGRLRMRLERFARQQARLVAEGWQIQRDLVEERFQRTFEVDGESFTVYGKIDRIDRHPQRGFRILDYKTSDTAKKPDLNYDPRIEEGFRWSDLQLPLYRFIAEAREVTGSVQLGYFNLPADPEDRNGGVQIAQWDEEALGRAAEERDRIIRSIRKSLFWPPAAPPPWRDGLERICSDGVTEREKKIASASARAEGAR
jgi:ATP-dependent helicase/nuclease subunit B